MIWCVEDDASIRDIEVYALQSTGIEARGFEDGTSFWEALNGGEKPELAVIDVMLPGISGIDLLRITIRGRPEGCLRGNPVAVTICRDRARLAAPHCRCSRLGGSLSERDRPVLVLTDGAVEDRRRALLDEIVTLRKGALHLGAHLTSSFGDQAHDQLRHLASSA